MNVLSDEAVLTTFDICEHGMSAWLCMGPNHYPSRDDEMNGRYF